MLGVGSLDQRALHGIVKDVDEGLSAHGVSLLDQRLHQSRFTAVQFNKNFFSRLQFHRAPDEEPGQFSNPRIFHTASSFLK